MINAKLACAVALQRSYRKDITEQQLPSTHMLTAVSCAASLVNCRESWPLSSVVQDTLSGYIYLIVCPISAKKTWTKYSANASINHIMPNTAYEWLTHTWVNSSKMPRVPASNEIGQVGLRTVKGFPWTPKDCNMQLKYISSDGVVSLD